MTDFTVAYIQKNGFSTPLYFKDKTGLDLKIPKSDFTVGDVRQCVGNTHIFVNIHYKFFASSTNSFLITFVGSRRMVDVMECSTQRNLEMTMKDWQQYYENPNRDRLLNVISLEFSHTKLEHMVHPPRTVK